MMGLAGAHRTGKTSLAREGARVLGVPFVETSTSAVFKAVGLDPAEPMNFTTRMMVQNLVLKDAIEKWQGYKDGFLSDRTPIDMLAYTMADIRGDTLDATGEALLVKYLRDCLKAAGDYFAVILLVQPGIPIVPAPGKAALSLGYMEHLNILMAGLMARKDFVPEALYMRRDTLAMPDRIAVLVNAYKRMIKQELQRKSKVAALH